MSAKTEAETIKRWVGRGVLGMTVLGLLLIYGDSRTPIALADSPTPKPRTHIVQRGDTLSGIGYKYGCPGYQVIANANNIPNPNVIKLGQVLNVPPSCSKDNTGGAVTIPKVDSLPALKPAITLCADRDNLLGTSEFKCELPENAFVVFAMDRMPSILSSAMTFSKLTPDQVKVWYYSEEQRNELQSNLRNGMLRLAPKGKAEHKNNPGLSNFTTVWTGGARGNGQGGEANWQVVVQTTGGPARLTHNVLDSATYNRMCIRYEERILGSDPITWTACKDDAFGGYREPESK